jgi:hypothetical protein
MRKHIHLLLSSGINLDVFNLSFHDFHKKKKGEDNLNLSPSNNTTSQHTNDINKRSV